MRSIALAVLVSMVVFPAVADVYRWTDDKGVVHYTDKPPAKDAKPVELPQIQTYKPSAASPSPTSPAAIPGLDPDAAVAVSGVQVVAPQPDETIRDAEGKISIVVSSSLQPGQGLIYYLDGKAQNEATASTGYLVTGAERGEHQISAAVVDADGRELARATPVTVFMMPSVVRRR